MRTAVIGAGVVAATSLSACEYADPPEKDQLGERLKRFFETGDSRELSGLFNEDSSIVFFEGLRTKNGFGYAYLGQSGVSKALIQLHADLSKDGYKAPCALVMSSFEGAMKEFEPNKLKLRFEEPEAVETSCGMSKTTRDVEILYRSSGPDDVIGSLAVLPPLSNKAVTNG